MKKNLKKSGSTFIRLSDVLASTSFLTATAALVISFVLISILLYIGYQQRPDHDAERVLRQAQDAISRELTESIANGDAMALNPELADAIEKEDQEAIAEQLSFGTNEKGSAFMAVTNDQGIVLNRTASNAKIGDNYFLNHPLGRRMFASGQSAASIEIRTNDPRELMLLSGRFVYKGDKKVGALLFGYATDNDYATYFARNYLPAGTEIGFYTKEYGLSGTSVQKEIGKELLARYVRPELEMIQTDHAKRFLLLPDGRFFIAQNLILPGSEDSGGGMLLFTPLPYITNVVIFCLLFPLVVFFIVLFFAHRAKRREEKTNWVFSPFIIGFIVLYVISCSALALGFYNRFIKFKLIPYPLYNSVLRFQPEGGVFDGRFAQRMSVILDSGGEAINAMRLVLSYNPKELKVQSVDMDRSICEHFILSEHNSVSGKIVMECIIPNPGFKRNGGIVTDLFFKPLPGVKQSSIHFLDDSEVLANDGLATNVLRLAVDSTMRFEESASIDTQKSLTLFSPTHPNPERWYSKKNITLSWAPNIPAELLAEMASHDMSPATLPPLKKTVQSDGIHAFKIQGHNAQGELISGELTARVDTTPPEELTLLASETTIKPGGLVRFEASGKDFLSGLQRVFYLKINDEIFFPISNQVYIPFPQAGTYTITLRAYDKAGNYRDVSKKIIVNRYQ